MEMDEAFYKEKVQPRFFYLTEDELWKWKVNVQPFPVNKRQSGVSRSSSTGGPFSNQNVANLQSLFASTGLQYAHGAWWRAP